MSKFEDKVAEIFQLYDPSKKAELEEMNRKQADEEAMKIIEK